MKNGFIYSLKDPRDNQIKYIGQTRFTVDKRYKEHLRNSKYESTKTHNVYCWISELLSLNLKPIIEIIETVDITELNDREKYWISKYKNEIKNMTEGGDGIKYINKRSFSIEHRKKIGDSCRGDKHYRYGKPAYNVKSICQFDFDGNYLNEYSSIKEASIKTKISQTSISFCVLGERNSAGNFIWVYKNVYENDNDIINVILCKIKENPSNSFRMKKVLKLDANNCNVIETYSSINEAGRKNNTSSSTISSACKSKTHYSLGYKWMFENE